MDEKCEKPVRFRPQRRMTPRSPTRAMSGPRYMRGLLIAVVSLLAIWQLGHSRYSQHRKYAACRNLPGASDTVVIMKTGVTEIEDRLPAQLENTLNCPPHYVIYSDHDEMFHGHRVRDVLSNISPDIKESNIDFTLYHRVKEVGREGLQPDDLTGVRTTDSTTDDDKVLLPGWVIDKWKFIPMMNETFHLYPDKKWYVFIESDTYLFWSTILKYVSILDHTNPHCIGHRTTRLSDHQFMQGGSGYVLSHEALRRVTRYIELNARELDLWMEQEWAGDISLGTVFNDAQVPLTYAWPIFQPAFFGVTYFGVEFADRRYWCYPAGTYHHMTPETITDIFNMEMDWIAQENDIRNPFKYISQGDVFNNVMLPRMRFPRYDWDNYCDIPYPEARTQEACRQACYDDRECKQFQFDSDLEQCKIAFVPLYGEPDLGSKMYSEWLFERIEKWRDDQPACTRETFLRYGDIDLDL